MPEKNVGQVALQRFKDRFKQYVDNKLATKSEKTHNHDTNYLKLLGGTLVGNVSLSVTPSDPSHIVNKSFVDNLIAQSNTGLTPMGSVVCMSMVNLAGTYATGVLTASANGIIPTVDGVTLKVGDKILLNNQTTGTQNGTYTVTNLGTASTKWVLTRSTDLDEVTELRSNLYYYIEKGTLYGTTGWVLTTPSPILDTTPTKWEQFSGGNNLTGGAGISINGGQVSLTSGVIASPGTYTKLTVDTYGRVTSATNMVAGDLPSHGNHVPATLSQDLIKFLNCDGTWQNIRNATTSLAGLVVLASALTNTSGTGVPTEGLVVTALNTKAPINNPVFTGKVTTPIPSTTNASLELQPGVSPTTPESGDMWNLGGLIKFYDGTTTRTVAYTDSNITGNAANVTGVVSIANGGTGASAKDVAYKNLSPMTALGDITFHNGSTPTRLAGNLTATKMFLTQTGTGSVSASPVWAALVKADVGLSNVENTALSTWAGSTSIVTVGNINPTGINVNDSTFMLKNTTTPTKQARFDLASLGASVTRVYTLQNKDGVIAHVSDIPNGFGVINAGGTNLSATLPLDTLAFNVGDGLVMNASGKTISVSCDFLTASDIDTLFSDLV